LLEEDLESAEIKLRSAESIFRRGELLPDLAVALTDLAELWRRRGDLEKAMSLCTESLSISSSRRIIPSEIKALATRSMASVDRHRSTNQSADLEAAKDDAKQALRLATFFYRLPWSELVAIRSIEYLSHGEKATTDGADARALLATLLQPELHSDRVLLDSLD
jgi:hypothetical protein